MQLEACIRVGVEIDELYPKPLSHFFAQAKGDKARLAEVMLKAYETRRQSRIAMVRESRKALFKTGQAAHAATTAAEETSQMSTVAQEREKQLARAAEAEAHEKKRLAFLKQKQEREMQEAVLFEVKRAEAAAKQHEEVTRMEEAEKQRQAKREEERLKMIELRREKELAKKEEEEKRAEQMRKLAMKELAEERKKHEAEMVELKKLVAKRKKEEEERAIKHMEEEKKRLVRTCVCVCWVERQPGGEAGSGRGEESPTATHTFACLFPICRMISKVNKKPCASA